MVIISFSRSAGREFVVEVTPSQGGARLRLLVPRELLDGALGADANESVRRGYIQKNAAEIQKAGDAVARGGVSTRMPFNKIVRFVD